MKLWEPFANTFKADQLTLFHTDNWTVLVRKNQVTLGTLVLAANRNFISASELTRDELLELPDVVDRLESALSDAFGFDKINYLLLMMSDRHYHSHVVPRYESPREFIGMKWIDDGWPGPPNVATPETSESTLLAIKDHLAQYL